MNLQEILKKQALSDGKSFDIKRRRTRNFKIDQTLNNKFEDCIKSSDDISFVYCGGDEDDDDDDSAATNMPSRKINNWARLVGDQCGFKKSFEKKIPLECHVSIDQRAVVSLALVKRQSSILGAYANKLPLMAINVSRLLYTIEAFSFRNYTVGNQTPIQQALDFFVRTDIAHRNVKLPPNQQFSEFLHCLRTTGYLEYIFDLARELDLNVDLIVGNSLIVRYIRVDVTAAEQNSCGIGYLTVLHQRNGAQWYVKTTKTPIVTDHRAEQQAIIDNSSILSSIHSTSAHLSSAHYEREASDLENYRRHTNLNSARSFINSLTV